MFLMKRWTTALLSRVDWITAQVENQEALVNSAIREAQQATARAKVQLGRVNNDGLKLTRRHKEENSAVTKWRQRARSCADRDEVKALECLRRCRQAEKKEAEFSFRLADHRKIQQQLQGDIHILEERLGELIEKRNLMRTRESRATAMCSVSQVIEPAGDGLDDIFDRWETRVCEAEIVGSCSDGADPLDDDFVSIEEEEALLAELEAMKSNSGDAERVQSIES